MKKKVICIVMCLLLVLPMFSCGFLLNGLQEPAETNDPDVTTGSGEPTPQPAKKPETAQELYDKIDEQMNALTSYKADISMSMTFFVGGYEIKGNATGYTTVGEDFFQQELTTKLVSDKLDLDQTQKNGEAYYNGNYFISNEQGDKVQKLYSEMTLEEARECHSENELDTIDFMKECATKNFQKLTGGTWELSCSGYTKGAIEKINESMGLDNEMLSGEIMDMKLVIKANEDYLVKQMKMELVFAEADDMPAVSVTMNYYQYNSASIAPDSLKTEDYRKVDDLKVLFELDKLLEELAERRYCNFTLDIEERVEDQDGNNLSEYTEENSILFGYENGDYFYDIDSVINGTDYNITYKDRIRTVTSGDESQKIAQTEVEAREWIKSLINGVGYSSDIVTYVESRGNGSYKLTCSNLNTDPYEEFYENNSAKLSSVTQTISVVIKDGRLARLSTWISASGSNKYGSLNVIISKTVVFESSTESSNAEI